MRTLYGFYIHSSSRVLRTLKFFAGLLYLPVVEAPDVEKLRSRFGEDMTRRTFEGARCPACTQSWSFFFAGFRGLRGENVNA